MVFENPRSLWGRIAATATRIGSFSMAGRFITGTNTDEAIQAIQRMRRQHKAFTFDVLGEATTCEAQAARYQQTYLDLIEKLGPAAAAWPEIPRIDRAGDGPMPRVNVSIKLTSLDPHFDPIDPARVRRTVFGRLRVILRAAMRHNAFVNIDMESFAVRDSFLAFSEPRNI